MVRILFVAVSVVCVSCEVIKQDDKTEWDNYKQKYNKVYKNEAEDKVHWEIYKKSKELIEKHNAKAKEGSVSFKLDVNNFADLQPEELNRYKGLKPGLSSSMIKVSPKKLFSMKVPESVDWRQKGAVSPVKNQGTCGSCWAFSVTGALEGQVFIKSNKTVNLSEQELIDCSKKNYGCNGGSIAEAFHYVIEYGLESEESYPYKNGSGLCTINKTRVIVNESSFEMVPAGETSLQQAVASIGPVSVAVYSTLESFHYYKSGIYNDSDCSERFQADHAVLVVGYGVENGNKYWIVKNSWGNWWGENGYMRLARDQNNLCGIASQAMFPVLNGSQKPRNIFPTVAILVISNLLLCYQ